jgi:hypothetical protein
VTPEEKKPGDGNSNDSTNKRVTTIPVPERGSPLVARADAEGTIHLLFNSEDGPKYVKSSNNGESFDPSIPLVDQGSRKPGLVFEGWDMAVGKGNRVHVAMSTNAWKLKLPKEEWGYFYTSLAPGEKAFAPVRNINKTPSEGFSVAADDKGTVIACWLSGKLYTNISRDNGQTFAPQIEINPEYDPCNCCTTSAVFGADGKLAVLYREETNNERDMYPGNTYNGFAAKINVAASSPSLAVAGLPSPTTAGVSHTFTVTALNADGTVNTGYTGTVHFTSSDPQAVLPADYTFTAADQGTHTFTATLKTAGGQVLAATDTGTYGVSGSEWGIAVQPAAASKFVLSAPASAQIGVAFSVTLTVEDAYGNVVTGYTGTVHFRSNDSTATLPANYTFTAADAGVHTWTGVILRRKGNRTLTVTDTLNSSLTATDTISVG